MIRIGVIYIATSNTSGKSYIGRDINSTERRNEHRREAYSKDSNAYNTHFHNAIRKYGFDDFEWNILYKATEDMLNIAEMCAIYVYDTYYSGYNCTFGGEGSVGYRHTPTSIVKMSKPRSGKARSNMSKAQMGKKASTMTRAKMSKARKGKKHSVNHKKGIAKAISLTYTVTHPNGVTEVVCNMKQYCLENNLSASKMCMVAKGKRKQHKGYRCEYYEETKNSKIS